MNSVKLNDLCGKELSEHLLRERQRKCERFIEYCIAREEAAKESFFIFGYPKVDGKMQLRIAENNLNPELKVL